MYKILTISGKDYKLEYTVEASLYKDGVDRLIDFIGGTFAPENEEKLTEKMEDEDRTKVRVEIMKNLRNEMINLPNTALVLFYSGLLEHHGEDGDGTILSLKDAKNLVKQLFSEQPEDGITDFAALLAVCMEQMAEDGFFKRTGLEKIMAPEEKAKPNRATRRASQKASGNKS